MAQTFTDHAGAVSAGLYVQTVYNIPPGVLPPVSKTDLDASRTAFSDAILQAQKGGPADTAEKNSKRADLIGLLRQLAAHVDTKHGNDLGVLLSSGFKAGKMGYDLCTRAVHLAAQMISQWVPTRFIPVSLSVGATGRRDEFPSQSSILPDHALEHGAPSGRAG